MRWRHVRLVVCTCGLLALLLTSARAQIQQGPDEQLEGTLLVVWGDPHPTFGRSSDVRYSLALEDGQVLPLQLAGQENLAAANFGRRVIVSGRRIARPLTMTGIQAPEAIAVDAISGIEPQPEGLAAPSLVSGVRSVIYLLVKFSDDAAVPHVPSFFTNLNNPITPPAGATFPSTVNGFFTKTSWNQFSWQGDVGGVGGLGAPGGWLTLPHPKSYYAPCGWSGACAKLSTLAADAVALGKAQGISFTPYDNVNFVLSNDLDCCAWGGSYFFDGKSFGATWEPPWGQETGTYAHEMGHSIGLPHSGWVYYAYDSPWDMMSSRRAASYLLCGSYFSDNSAASSSLWCYEPGDGYIAAHKDEIGWIPTANKVVTDTFTSGTWTLEGGALPLGSALKMIKICLPGFSCTGSTARYFTVEARVKALGAPSQYDNGIPAEGVIIHDVRKDRPAISGACFFNSQSGWALPIDATPGDYNSSTCSNSGALMNAQWMPGQTYVNSTYAFNVSVLSRSGSTFDVSVTPTGGSISGTVTDAVSGLGVSSVVVSVFSSGGTFMASSTTSGNGSYTIGGLSTGTYYVRTGALAGVNNIDELYNDIPCVPACTVTSGTPIGVTAGLPTQNIDFVLARGGIVSGTVTDAPAAPFSAVALSGIPVNLYTPGQQFVKSAITTAGGGYTITGLPAGIYYARTAVSSATNTLNELYSELPCATSCTVTTGTPITVTAGATTPNINFTLATGGRVSGTVTNAATGAGFANITVSLYDSGGSFVTSVVTPASGIYTTAAVPAGSYFARTGNSLGFADELYNDIPCAGCDVTTGTPITVTSGATTSPRDFALSAGGAITGTVTNAAGGALLAGVVVDVFNSNGNFATSAATNGSGVYTVIGLPLGNYYLATTNFQGFVDELYDDIPCPDVSCTVTGGAPVSVTGTGTTTVDFALTAGGTISGTVTDTTGAATVAGGTPIAGVTVKIFDVNGIWVGSASTNGSGVYTPHALPTGTYYARTALPKNSPYVDELYQDLPCLSDCVVTAGAPISVTAGATTVGVDFSLAPNLVHNGTFDSGTANWLQFALPSMSNIVSAVVNGVFEYTRVAPPSGTPGQAVIFQNTGAAAASGAALAAQFDLGNSSSVRKRISVLILDSNFSDLSVCTFWLPPNTPLRSYQMHTHTNQAWTNASIYFYAATPGSDGGSYQVDNVLLFADPSASSARTDCADPDAPTILGLGSSTEMLTNGDFSNGTSGWLTFGNLTSQLTGGGVLEFIRPTPPVAAGAGVVFQPTGQATATGEVLTATFQMGNSSGVRKRVTVLMHDQDFSDLTACTFYLAPGQGLLSYAMGAYVPQGWTNATLSFYAATTGNEQSYWLDNVTFQRTPGATVVGTECVEPGGGGAFSPTFAHADASSGPARVSASGFGGQPAAGGTAAGSVVVNSGSSRVVFDSAWEGVATDSPSIWQLDTPIDLTTATDAEITFSSWLSAQRATATVQVSTDDGANWLTVAEVSPSETWSVIDVHLSAYTGSVLDLRFVLDPTIPNDVIDADDGWRVKDVEVNVP